MTEKPTKPQKFSLGKAVEEAFRYGWDGEDQDSDHFPYLNTWGRVAYVVPRPTIQSLERRGLVEEENSIGGRRRLSQAGVEAGIEECVERTGQHPKERFAAEREEKEAKEEQAQERLAQISGRLAHIDVVEDDEQVSLGGLIQEAGVEGAIRVDLAMWEQIAAHIGPVNIPTP